MEGKFAEGAERTIVWPDELSKVEKGVETHEKLDNKDEVVVGGRATERTNRTAKVINREGPFALDGFASCLFVALESLCDELRGASLADIGKVQLKGTADAREIKVDRAGVNVVGERGDSIGVVRQDSKL